MSGRNRLAIEHRTTCRSAAPGAVFVSPIAAGRRSYRAEAHQRYPNGRAVVDPRLVAPGLENGRGGEDAFEHAAVGAAADRVGGDQPDTLRLARLDLRAGLLEPVGDEVGATGHAILVYAIERLEVLDRKSKRLNSSHQKISYAV